MPEELEDIELRNEEVQDILTRVPHWMIRWGSTLFLSLIVLVLVLSWFIKYPDIILAQAIITTEIPPQKEYARITGKIDTILVKDGQQVHSGTPLAILENTANYQDVLYLSGILDTVRVSTQSFTFPIDRIPILFLGDVETDFAVFDNNYAQYMLNKELQPFINQSQANALTLAELQRRLNTLMTQRKLNESELAIKKNELDRNKTLYERGVISTQEYEYKQSEYLRAEQNYNNIVVSLSQIRESISNAQKNVRGTEIDRTREEINLLKNVVQSFDQLKRAVRDWKQRYLLQSRMYGKVSFLNYWNENQTVNTGDLVFTVIPTQSTNYVAKLRAPSQNSGKIKVGQQVNLKLANYPDTEFGVLRGELSSISLIPDDEGIYLIDVTLPNELITTYDREIDFRQEMRAVAEIVTEDLRLIDRFFYQFRELISRE